MGKNNRNRRSEKKLIKEKRLKRRKKKASVNSRQSIGPVFHMMDNPFSGLSEEDRRKAIEEISANSEKSYQDNLEKLVQILSRYDPFILMSILATYGLTVGVGDDGITKRDSELKIHQAHLEIAQALTLQIEPDMLKRELFGPDVVQQAWDALVELMNVHALRGLAQVLDIDSEEEKAVRGLQQRMRSNTKMVRNWGYFSQVITISRELYGYFDDALEASFRFSISDVIRVFKLIIEQIEALNTSRYKSLSRLYDIKNKKELVRKYYDLIGEDDGDAERFINDFGVEGIDRQSLFMMLVSHYDMRLNEQYEFSVSQLSGLSGLEESKVSSVLDKFSCQIGELASVETEFLYLSNPVWLRPLVKVSEERYFCVIPQVFFSFIIPSLDGLVGSIGDVGLSDRRSAYLESKIVEIINRRFPESNTVSGVKWRCDGEEYETDLITFIDSHALIVEAKSGKITEPALRGAPSRLKRHIEEILVAPNIQSRRLEERLKFLISNPEQPDDLRSKLPVDLNTIHKIIRVSVSLEDFASIQANVSEMTGTGWLPENFVPCPTMSLADFETLFDLLEHPVQILHYLGRRQSLEDDLGYMGDELDLMGLYLTTLFNLGDVEKGVNFIISEMSSPLDVYYNSKDSGVITPKPEPVISPLFKRIFRQLEKRSTPRWTEIGVILNMLSPDDQVKLTKMITSAENNVTKNWMKDGHKNMIIFIPPKASEYALGYVVYNNNTSGQRDEFIDDAARTALEYKHVKQCLVIAKNIDRTDHEYHFIGLME